VTVSVSNEGGERRTLEIATSSGTRRGQQTHTHACEHTLLARANTTYSGTLFGRTAWIVEINIFLFSDNLNKNLRKILTFCTK